MSTTDRACHTAAGSPASAQERVGRGGRARGSQRRGDLHSPRHRRPPTPHSGRHCTFPEGGGPGAGGGGPRGSLLSGDRVWSSVFLREPPNRCKGHAHPRAVVPAHTPPTGRAGLAVPPRGGGRAVRCPGRAVPTGSAPAARRCRHGETFSGAAARPQPRAAHCFPPATFSLAEPFLRRRDRGQHKVTPEPGPPASRLSAF